MAGKGVLDRAEKQMARNSMITTVVSVVIGTVLAHVLQEHVIKHAHNDPRIPL